MSAPRFRAWRFNHRVLDSGDPPGLTLKPTGAIDMVEHQRSVRQAILLLLATRPGERVMRPDYGCDLQRLVFSPNDDTTAGLAIHYVRRALERWEPRIEILKLDADRRPEDPGTLIIQLEYRLRGMKGQERLAYWMPLMGGPS